MNTQEAKKELQKAAISIFNGADFGYQPLNGEQLEEAVNRRDGEVSCEVSEAGKRCKLARMIRNHAFEKLHGEVAENLKECRSAYGLETLIDAQSRLHKIILNTGLIIQKNGGH